MITPKAGQWGKVRVHGSSSVSTSLDPEFVVGYSYSDPIVFYLNSKPTASNGKSAKTNVLCWIWVTWVIIYKIDLRVIGTMQNL